ncbi:hypothetical protein F9B85_00900 [Heliorestis acidaminivorans]|uniref:Uncharacterized protein n=1 Tax=Heliorestis acidaminivorans TaxID=553427 RepID=A0A6I0EV79_9FIRM|nr:hypothetical protein [Heliorestis acidaminivorans]KAB2954284.1 hypothetical protein F9B85_00900 [Heliorestis acidaminivorans]
MSAFLGPIHHWLYRKILLVVEREQLIFEKAQDLCSNTAEELRQEVWETYGEPLPNIPLNQLIDGGNIHGWLQSQITIAETREAAYIKKLTDLCGDTAQSVIEDAFSEQGTLCGQDAVEKGATQVGADEIYKLLNNYLLNGMPCDQVNKVVINESTKVTWESAICLQERNWKEASVDGSLMKRLYGLWIDAFVKAINPTFAYRQTADTLKGDWNNRHEITSA